jgi:hypothetical protein
MSTPRHRFRHLADRDYQRLFGEGPPLPAPTVESVAEDVEFTFTPDARFPSRGGRSYDPSTGRWTCQDALRFQPDSVNLYRYPTGDSADSDLGPAGSLENHSYGWTGRSAEAHQDLCCNRTRTHDPNRGVWLDHDGRVVPAEVPSVPHPPADG